MKLRQILQESYMHTLTPSEKEQHFDTLIHIREVQKNLITVVDEMLRRMMEHDTSKFESEIEASKFAEVTPLLKHLKYGSKEYKESLKKLGPALEHHYKHNSHHPEHYENGINGMDLFDLIEMVCDWAASVKRNADGNLSKSLQHNKDRFNIDDQLYDILNNTIKKFKS